MGLLDSKQQFLDTIVTNEGRRQLAAGRMRIRFATLTDQDAYYEADHVSGTTDASQRPHLEAFSRPQDTITFESDDVGLLLQYRGSSNDVIAGNVLVPTGDRYLQYPDRESRRDAQLQLLTSSIDNFQKLYSIATDDPLDDDDAFTLSTNRVSFDVYSGMLSNRQGTERISLDEVQSLFQDRRVSHAKNFRYLPPRNTPTPEDINGSLLGRYPRLDQGEILTVEELWRELRGLERKTIRFSETSRDSNIFGQIFEIRDDVLRKLDVIDFGEFIDPNSPSGNRHVFFVGRLLLDSKESHTFINLFTLVFS